MDEVQHFIDAHPLQNARCYLLHAKKENAKAHDCNARTSIRSCIKHGRNWCGNHTHSDKGSDSKHLDDLVREYLNTIDKAIINIYNETGSNIVVVATEDNYSRLQQVADRPLVYSGQEPIIYNNTTTHHIAKQAWEIIRELQHRRRTEAISDIREAVGQGMVLTDLQEIYQASIDGRGDLLIVHQDFAQPVHMTSDRTFELVGDTSAKEVIDDITSYIAWEVLSKKGKVFFTEQDEIKDLGAIVLKTRY